MLTFYAEGNTRADWTGQAGVDAGTYPGFSNVRLLWASWIGNLDNIQIGMRNYQESKLEPLSEADADAHLILIQYKHEHWKYEKEVRFLKANPGPVKFTTANICIIITSMRYLKK